MKVNHTLTNASLLMDIPGKKWPLYQIIFTLTVPPDFLSKLKMKVGGYFMMIVVQIAMTLKVICLTKIKPGKKDLPFLTDYGYPYTPYKFCGTHVNASHTVVTGGQINYDGSTISDVWFYNWEDNSWKAGPHMTIPRRLHDCIGISNNRVMVAGGVGLNEEALVSVEIFDPALRPGGGWYQVQDLPEDDYFYDTTLLFNSEIIWINSRHIWKFVDDVWLKLDSELSNDPSYRLTMLVPDNFVPSKLFENRAYL